MQLRMIFRARWMHKAVVETKIPFSMLRIFLSRKKKKEKSKKELNKRLETTQNLTQSK